TEPAPATPTSGASNRSPRRASDSSSDDTSRSMSASPAHARATMLARPAGSALDASETIALIRCQRWEVMVPPRHACAAAGLFSSRRRHPAALPLLREFDQPLA